MLYVKATRFDFRLITLMINCFALKNMNWSKNLCGKKLQIRVFLFRPTVRSDDIRSVFSYLKKVAGKSSKISYWSISAINQILKLVSVLTTVLFLVPFDNSEFGKTQL